MGKRKKQHRTSSNKKKLKTRLQSDPAFKNMEVVESPADEEKMSAVILRFVEPYTELVETKEAFERLIVMAMVAWNSTLLAGTARQELLDLFKETLPSDNDQEWQSDAEQILAQMMRRKERHFPDNQRFIIDYRVSESRDEYKLAIVSTPLQSQL
jgi:hypothetical protein